MINFMPLPRFGCFPGLHFQPSLVSISLRVWRAHDGSKTIDLCVATQDIDADVSDLVQKHSASACVLCPRNVITSATAGMLVESPNILQGCAGKVGLA